MKKETQDALEKIKQNINRQFKDPNIKSNAFVQFAEIVHMTGKIGRFLVEQRYNQMSEEDYAKYFMGIKNQIAKVAARLTLLHAYLEAHFDDDGKPREKN